jgi:hypothetical protein
MTDAFVPAADDADTQPDPGVPPRTWVGLGAAAIWATTLLHEAAHHLGVVTLVRPYGGNSAPVWVWVTMSASGPVASLLIMGAACAVAARNRGIDDRGSQGRLRLSVAVGSSAAMRFFIVAGAVALSLALKGRVEPGFDEGSIARVTGVPTALLVGAGTLLAGIGTVWLIAQLPRAGRGRAGVWLAVGLLAGFVAVTTIGRAFGFAI